MPGWPIRSPRFWMICPTVRSPSCGSLAVHDPLPLADLIAMTSAEGVQEAQRCGVVSVDDAVARCVHPLFLSTMRATVGGPGLRRLRSKLVERLSAAPRRGVVDRLRVAVLALDSDADLPADELSAPPPRPFDWATWN